MDYTNLDDKEVKMIINRIKYQEKILSFQEIKNKISTMFGKIDIDEIIIDDEDLLYILTI